MVERDHTRLRREWGSFGVEQLGVCQCIHGPTSLEAEAVVTVALVAVKVTTKRTLVHFFDVAYVVAFVANNMVSRAHQRGFRL